MNILYVGDVTAKEFTNLLQEANIQVSYLCLAEDN